jgi:hypothetical protein
LSNRYTGKAGGDYLVIEVFFTTGDLDGPGAEILPDERALLRIEEGGNVRCSFRLGT